MADAKLTALTAITSFSGDELFYVVDDDDGTPVSRKITVEDLATALAGRSELQTVLNGLYAPLAAVGCALTKSAVQSVNSATSTAVTFDGEEFDDSGFHDNSSNTSRITIPTGLGGLYLFGGSAEIGFLSDQFHVILRLRKNGSTVLDGRGRLNNSSGTTAGFLAPTFSRVVRLAAGDYIELMVEHNHGSARDVRESSNGTSFWCTRIGS